MSWDQDHWDCDELGGSAVYCMRCHKLVKKRVEVPSKIDPSRSVLAMLTLANYREREVELSDGSLLYLILCKDCENEPVDAAKAVSVTIRGWEKELRAAGRPDVAIERMKRDRKNLKILKVNRSLTEFEHMAEDAARDKASQDATKAVKGNS